MDNFHIFPYHLDYKSNVFNLLQVKAHASTLKASVSLGLMFNAFLHIKKSNHRTFAETMQETALKL